jgi:hypothetical protein
MITKKKRFTRLFESLTLILTLVHTAWNHEILAALSQSIPITMHEKECTKEELKKIIEIIKWPIQI